VRKVNDHLIDDVRYITDAGPFNKDEPHNDEPQIVLPGQGRRAPHTGRVC